MHCRIISQDLSENVRVSIQLIILKINSSDTTIYNMHPSNAFKLLEIIVKQFLFIDA